MFKRPLQRRIIAWFMVALICLPLGLSATAATDLAPPQNPLCWQAKDCAAARSRLIAPLDSMNQAAAGEGWLEKEGVCNQAGWGKCLAAGATKTQIAFGGKREFLHLGDFIQYIYRYAIVIAGLLAVIMLIMAGAQWVTSGGNSEAITSAKKRIGGALMGLFLAYMSYFILNTLNPALVQFRLPQVYMVREDLNLGKEFGEACNNNGDCKKPLSCLGVKNSPAEKMLNLFGAGLFSATAGVVAIGSGAVAAVATKAGTAAGLVGAEVAAHPFAVTVVGGSIIGVGCKATTFFSGTVAECLKGVAKKPFVGAYNAAKAIPGELVSLYQWVESVGAKGVCALEANRNVPRGGLCAKDEHCSSGFCLVNPVLAGSLGGLVAKGAGFCADGKLGSTCDKENDSYDPGTCDVGLFCSLGAGLGGRQCANRQEGSACDIKNPASCASGLICKEGGLFSGVARCALKEEGVEGTACAEDFSCTRNGEFGTVENPAFSCFKPVGGGAGFCHQYSPANTIPEGSGCFKDADCNQSQGQVCVNDNGRHENSGGNKGICQRGCYPVNNNSECTENEECHQFDTGQLSTSKLGFCALKT